MTKEKKTYIYEFKIIYMKYSIYPVRITSLYPNIVEPDLPPDTGFSCKKIYFEYKSLGNSNVKHDRIIFLEI
jgi:hypothetical protein